MPKIDFLRGDWTLAGHYGSPIFEILFLLPNFLRSQVSNRFGTCEPTRKQSLLYQISSPALLVTK